MGHREDGERYKYLHWLYLVFLSVFHLRCSVVICGKFLNSL